MWLATPTVEGACAVIEPRERENVGLENRLRNHAAMTGPEGGGRALWAANRCSHWHCSSEKGALALSWLSVENSAQPHETAARPLQRAAGHIKGTHPLVDSGCHHGKV